MTSIATEPNRTQQTTENLVITDQADELAALRAEIAGLNEEIGVLHERINSQTADLRAFRELTVLGFDTVRDVTAQRDSARRQLAALREELRTRQRDEVAA